jgi:hypothetical protein
LDGIKKRIRRLVTNLEAQESRQRDRDDILFRLEELGAIRSKNQGALESAERELRHVPDPQSAEALLAALNFEASYETTKRELTIRVMLVPELTSPDGGRAPPLYVPPATCPRREPNVRGAPPRSSCVPCTSLVSG